MSFTRKCKQILLSATASVALLAGSGAWAKTVELELSPSQKFVPANKARTMYIKISLTGAQIEQKLQRTPANIAIVLDKSGSMNGIKIVRAKEAAIMALQRLTYQDIASVVAYDHRVEVIQPATRINNHYAIANAIRRIYPGGSTALFAGVSKGAEEVRKFLNKNQINRVILLSDGRANVGPQTPTELGKLGQSLSREGISVTTIGLGLGYNEDLMETLARRSGGNHAFAENASDLAKIFQKEFNDVLSVVAQNAVIRIRCMPGVKPVRVLGREARIHGQSVEVDINQVYNRQQKYLVLEVQVPAGKHGSSMQLATVSAKYNNMQTKLKDTLTSTVNVNFTKSPKAVTRSIDKKVMATAVEFISARRNEEAMRKRDRGDVSGAASAFRQNEKYLRSNARRYKSGKLRSMADSQADKAKNVRGPKWNRTRKMLKKEIYRTRTQQSY